MRRTGYLLSFCLLTLLLAGCSGEDGKHDSGNGVDEGPECLTDADCTPPETCQEDQTCKYIPDPNDNKAAGNFDLYMNVSDIHGTIEVSGELDAKYLYLDVGGKIIYNQQKDRVEMQLFGWVTNRLLKALVAFLPRDCPINQEINFGVGGVLIGTIDEVEVELVGENLVETSRRSVAEIIDGFIKFSQYSTANNSPIVGELEVDFRPVK